MARSESVELIANVTAEVSDAVSDLGRFGSSLDDVSREADRAGQKVSGITDKTDELDSKSAAATGSLGALASGFELVGADQYAGALQGAAMATDFFSGIGQGLTLLLELQSVQWLKNKIAIAASTVATIAQTAATWLATAATTALGVAMAIATSPITLVVLAVLAVVAGLILLYKKVPFVQRVVDALWGALKAGATAAKNIAVGAFNAIYNAAFSVINWVRTKWGAIQDMITGPITDAGDAVADVWDAMLETVKGLPGKIGGYFEDVYDAVTDALSGLGSAITDVFDDALQGVVDLINKLIRAFNRLPGPNIPQISLSASSGASRTALAAPLLAAPRLGLSAAAQAPLAAGGGDVTIVIQGAVDPESTARQVRRLLASSGIRHGVTTDRTLRILRRS